MSKRSWHAIVLLLVSIGLALSACQSQPATVAPPTAEPTQEAVVQDTSPLQPTETVDPSRPTPIPRPGALWTFATGGAIWDTGTIADGICYFGSDDGNLYALDLASHQLKWKSASQGIVRSRPALAGGLVYFASDDGNLYAVDAHDGEQVWRRDIGDALPREMRANLGSSPVPTGYDYRQSSPVVAGDLVYVGSKDGNVYALAAATGDVVWTHKTGEKVRATPTVDNGTVYVGSWDESFYALDAQTGQERWVTPLQGEVQSTALVAGGLVYCASRKASVVAMDAQTGDIKWEYSYGQNLWVESSPRLVDGVIYIGSSGSKMVVGIDAKTGKEFTKFLSPIINWSTPAIEGDTLYIGGIDSSVPGIGGLLALELVHGKFASVTPYRFWFRMTDSLELTGHWSGAASSPVILNGVIYLGGLDGVFYALKAHGT